MSEKKEGPPTRKSARKQAVASAFVSPAPANSVNRAGAPAAVRKLLSDPDWQLHQVSKNKVQRTSNVAAVPVPLADSPPSKIPEATRGIMEYQELSTLIAENTACRKCRRVGLMRMTFPSVAITCRPTIFCEGCGYSVQSQAKTTGLERGKRGADKVTDFALNVLFVVGFLTSGDGGTEAQRLMALLGLPHVQSMEKDTFRKIERAITPSIKEIAEEALRECVVREVIDSMRDDEEFNQQQWLDAVNNKITIHPEQYPMIKISMDMGWQKRSSGRRYDSHSGHAFSVGVINRDALAMAVMLNICLTCRQYEEDPERSVDEIPEHDCLRNHVGSSGSMEAAALIEMIELLYDKYKVIVSVVITDDDSKMKAQCKWSNEDFRKHYGKEPPRVVSGKTTKPRPDHGKLRYPIPEPSFLADPSHRKKTLRNRLYAILRRKKKDRLGLNESDIVRITTNFAYMTRQLPGLDTEEWNGAALAVLEHHFDNHEHCGDFCQRRKELEKEKNGETSTAGKKFYRNKELDAALYTELQSVIEDFITPERLKEVGHGYDTNKNEALNNIVSWFAPKNRNYCLTNSLRNRVCIAIAINILGLSRFYQELFEKLGIEQEEATRYYAVMRDKERNVRTVKSQSFEKKKSRNKRLYEKLQGYLQLAKQDRDEGTGYGAGVGMPKKQRANKVSDTDKVCGSCGQRGHLRSNHRDCPNNKKSARNVVLEEEAQEQSMMDQIDLSEQAQEYIDDIVAIVEDVFSEDEEEEEVLSNTI